MSTLGQGANYRIDARRGVVVAAVVRRPELTLAQDVEAMRQMFATVREHLDTAPAAHGTVLLDLRRAAVPVPETRAVIGEFLRHGFEAGHRIGIVTRHATMAMLFRRLLVGWSEDRARCFESPRAAARWATPRQSSAAQPLGFRHGGTSTYRSASFDERTRLETGVHTRTASRQHGTLVAHGDSYALYVEARVGVLVVVRRPDLSLERGAACTQEMLATTARLRSNGELDTLVLDLRDAPVPDASTRASLVQLLASWAGVQRRIGVVVGQPTMRMLFARLCSAHAPAHAEVFDELRAARLWVAGVSREAIVTSRATLDDADSGAEDSSAGAGLIGAPPVLGTDRDR